jgi:hypothetical protein
MSTSRRIENERVFNVKAPNYSENELYPGIDNTKSLNENLFELFSMLLWLNQSQNISVVYSNEVNTKKNFMFRMVLTHKFGNKITSFCIGILLTKRKFLDRVTIRIEDEHYYKIDNGKMQYLIFNFYAKIQDYNTKNLTEALRKFSSHYISTQCKF